MIFTHAKIIGEQIDPKVYHASVGEHDGRPAQRGEAEFVVSRSSLMDVLLCAERWRNGYLRKESDATDYGSRFDTLVLDAPKWSEKYVIAPAAYPCEPTKKDPRTEKPWSGNSDWCKAWKSEAEKAGQEVISAKEDEEVKTAVIALFKQPEIGALILGARKQVFVTAEYIDRTTGLTVPVKALIDLVPLTDGFSLGDLKSSSSADPNRWGRTCFEFNYDAQAALYLDLYNAATGEARTDFFHVVQENFSPWQVMFPIPKLSVELLEIGRQKVQAALAHYCRCLKTGEWPAYCPMRTLIHPYQLIDALPWMVGTTP